MNKQQQKFLDRLALRIPRLFEAIAQGNVKSEYIVGVRYIGARHVRLKLVAEVVDPGANPLATHGQMRPVAQGALRSVDISALDNGGRTTTVASDRELQSTVQTGSDATASEAGLSPGSKPASQRRRSRKR